MCARTIGSYIRFGIAEIVGRATSYCRSQTGVGGYSGYSGQSLFPPVQDGCKIMSR